MSCDCNKPGGHHEHYCAGEMVDDWLKDQRPGEFTVALKGFEKAPDCKVIPEANDYDWVEQVIQERQEHQRKVFKKLLQDFPRSKEEMAQRGWESHMKEKKPETMQEAADNLSKAFKGLGISIADVAEKDLKALKRALEVEELRLLIQAATQKMKDDHDVMMRKARRQIIWLLLLVACAIAYEVWAIPWLEVHWLGIKR